MAEGDEEKADSGRTAADVASTYFAEGFPYAIVNNLPELLFKELGFGLEVIGLTALLHKPWNLKFLWAPFCEVVSRKRLLVVMELLLGALLFVPVIASFFASHAMALFGLFFAMAVLSATHDIAVDGYYLEALSEAEQSRFVGLRQVAYRLSNLLVRGPLLALLGLYGMTKTFSLMGAILVSLGVFHFFFLREPRAKSGRTSLDLVGVGKTLVTIPRVGRLVAFAILFRAGEALLQKMRYPFLSEHFHVRLEEYALVSGTFGVVASLFGTTLGGFLLARHGLRRWFWPFIAAQNGLNLLYAALALGWFGSSSRAAFAVLLGDEFGSGLGTSALLVFLMHLCRGEHKTAHFAFWTALMSLAFTYAGAVSGFLAKAYGFSNFFVLTFVASLPMMGLALFLPETRVRAPSREPRTS